MTEDTPWTFGRLLQWTTVYLKDHGSESPRLDAEVLLAFAAQCQRIELYTRFDELPSEELKTRFRALVKQRAQGVPVAYLVGFREFYSLTFRVNAAVLVPRPETEFVVVGALDLIKADPRGVAYTWNIADVGTGSGAIAVTLAKQLPHAQLVATDISEEALAVAVANATDHHVIERVHCIACDLLRGVTEPARFDLIVSNPPYIARREEADLPRDVVKHEPRLALFGGDTGLEIIERLIEVAASRLVPGGWLLCEMSPPQVDAISAILERQGGWRTPRYLHDLSHRPRVLQVQMGSEHAP